ncbi:MAG: methyltransferase domain-containing protein [Candidatus Eisenbacteria bacterium]|nr:methyltransferase domain-containing protein [Candidatus Latescibacterota bacterium]MBD3302945.1 methyltransferase domain-containing protein [Candidatus Eisenbacteria bacterium]
MDRSGGYVEAAFVAELYDRVVPYRDRPDVPFYVEEAVRSLGPVLELGCGTGRVLIPIAREGIRITGLDLSVSMLAVCRARLAEEPDEVRQRAEIVQGDMRCFALNRRFALATIPFRAFQHLTAVEDQLSCLDSVHRHLDEGGRLILDLFNPSLPSLVQEIEPGKPMGEDPEFEMPDGRRVVRSFRLRSRDWHAQLLDVEMIYAILHPSGRIERLVHRFPLRYFFRFEVEHLLHRAGFRVERLYSGYDRDPYGSRYPGELVFVARKA